MLSSRSTLVALAAVLFAIGPADAARVLVAEMLARPAVAAGQPAMTALALEACLSQARALDATGNAIDLEIAGIDRLAAEGILLQNQINAEMPMLGGYDEAALNDFQRRLIRHDTVARQYQAQFPLYQEKQKAYDAEVAAFDRDCAGGIRGGDRDGVKAKLGIP